MDASVVNLVKAGVLVVGVAVGRGRNGLADAGQGGPVRRHGPRTLRSQTDKNQGPPVTVESAVRLLPANTHWLRGNAHQTDARNDILDCFGRSDRSAQRACSNRPLTGPPGTLALDGPGPAPQQIGGRCGAAAHGVSFTRRPWTGRPESFTSRAQPSHCPVSFTTLNSSTLTPRFSPTGPTVSNVTRLCGRRAS